MLPSNIMTFNHSFLEEYIEIAPAALAIERSLECEILSSCEFVRPVLDIGCGDGVFAKVLFVDRVNTGIDYDPAEIGRARQHDRYDELICCGGASIPKENCSFETIFSNSVLEHIPDVLPVLREQYRLLRPGGRFYVTIPTDRWEKASIPARAFRAVGLAGLADKYARSYNSFWRHYHAYPEERWIALFQNVGFEVVDKKTYAPPDVTTLLDGLTFVAGPAIVTKKIAGRWIVLPALRRILAPALSLAAARMLRACDGAGEGNLLFLALTKTQ